MIQEERLFGGVGLGTFPLASPFSPLAEDERGRILDAYFAQGGVYLDTAPTYAFGGVEQFLGEYLSSRDRQTFAVSTSGGYVMNEETKSVHISGKRDDILKELEQSLRRLRLEFVDIYISHVPDPHTPKSETAKALAEIKEQGLAKRIGVSNVNYEQLHEYVAAAAIDIVQNRYSFLNRSLPDDFIELCVKNGIGVVAYQVIERGQLTQRGVSVDDLGADDLRRRKPEFRTDRVNFVRSLIGSNILPIAEDAGMPIEDLMIRWCVHQPGIALAQVGATRHGQVQILPLRDQAVPQSILERLESAYNRMLDEIRQHGFQSIREMLGLDEPTVQSATGR